MLMFELVIDVVVLSFFYLYFSSFLVVKSIYFASVRPYFNIRKFEDTKKVFIPKSHFWQIINVN